MFLLGVDLGTSSIKVSVVDSQTQKILAQAQYPDTEADIISAQTGWAEQDPDTWWQFTKRAIQKLNASGSYDPKEIKAIGISYQMHGLVIVDKDQQPLRNSIIWCDSRAVEIGNKAYESLGSDYCLSCLLNSPGNFTASKLAWVKQNEPATFDKIHTFMLPGDFLAMKFTGNVTATPSGLSEGIFWDFDDNAISSRLLEHYGFNRSLIPEVRDVFADHGQIRKELAAEFGFSPSTIVSYKAGDQLNNALSLNVFEPGEVAATAGTSGVIYAVTDHLFKDRSSRVNSFAHVNHSVENLRLGVLLCINGVGIMNKWIRQIAGNDMSYAQLNQEASAIAPGSEGLLVLPFGNGAERMLENKLVNAHFSGIDFNRHTKAHMFRAVQEGIAFAFRYGLDIMRENSLNPSVIKAGKANMFLSQVFLQSFVNATGVPVELYNNDGSVGAALGAGIGAKAYNKNSDAFSELKPVASQEPQENEAYEEQYAKWKSLLQQHL